MPETNAITTSGTLRGAVAAEPPPGHFQLQILHASDLEGGLDAIERARNFAALADLFEDQYANSITLSSGDNYIPGTFFSAGGDPEVQATLNAVYNDLFDTNLFTDLAPAGGRIDISIMNVIGFDASAFGNHDFDAGPNAVAEIIGGTLDGDDIAWIGAQFPYLSANLDFSNSNLAGLMTGITDSGDFRVDPNDIAGTLLTPKIAPATIIEENGELIGVVGATTQILEQISSPGAVDVIDPEANDMDALAAILQPTIDALIAQGVDKIILTSHLQQLALEQELAGKLSGVDVIIAGGSHTLLADGTDALRPGDTAAGQYPIATAGADGNPTLIVNTSSEYSYLGRLVLEFDETGNIVTDSLDPAINGAYATTDAGVAAAYAGTGIDPFADGSKGDLVGDLADAVGAVIAEKDANVFGLTDVYLEGLRTQVRVQETNLGNLTADANLHAARQRDDTVSVSIKNGGGIRAPIGTIDPATGDPLPPADGEISQLDIENALRFNNELSIVTVSTETFLDVVEHAFAATMEGATPGQFPQIGGFAVSFDPSLPAGERVRSLAIVDAEGDAIRRIVENGEIIAGAPANLRLVTLSFLADGGDGYPFSDEDGTPLFTDRVDLTEAGLEAGDATFADAGTEQDALAEYLDDFYRETAYAEADTDLAQDQRIQNLDAREDGVLDGAPIDGTQGDDRIAGTDGDDLIRGRDGDDRLFGRDGADRLRGGEGDDALFGREGDDILLGEAGADVLRGGYGEDRLLGGAGDDRLFGGAGDDVLRGEAGADRLKGGAGEDRLFGGAGEDRLDGGRGDDVLSGGDARDVFHFDAGFGADAVRDFQAGLDAIRISEAVVADFAALLDTAREVGDAVVFRLEGGDTLRLDGVDLDALRAADFHFV